MSNSLEEGGYLVTTSNLQLWITVGRKQWRQGGAKMGLDLLQPDSADYKVMEMESYLGS